jgi:hypothetical protein
MVSPMQLRACTAITSALSQQLKGSTPGSVDLHSNISFACAGRLAAAAGADSLVHAVLRSIAVGHHADLSAPEVRVSCPECAVVAHAKLSPCNFISI